MSHGSQHAHIRFQELLLLQAVLPDPVVALLPALVRPQLGKSPGMFLQAHFAYAR